MKLARPFVIKDKKESYNEAIDALRFYKKKTFTTNKKDNLITTKSGNNSAATYYETAKKIT